MENKESNILIAEFMGFTLEKNIGWYDNDMNMPQIVYDNEGGNCFDELLFDKDWNWLMSVVEKIYKTDLYYSKYIDFNSSMFTNGKIEITTGIENLYNDCIEFIKWFNNENK